MTENEQDRDNRLSDVTALILAGGRGRRIGAEKPLLELDGHTLLQHVREHLEPFFGELIIVTNRPKLYSGVGLKVITDEVPYQGPLAGICAGLEASSSECNFVVASDMPFVRPEVILKLRSLLGHADVAVASMAAGIEPLLGFYNKACLTAIRRHLEAGDRHPIAFYADSDVAVRLVKESEVRRIDPDLLSWFNINTPEDLAKARDMLEHVK